MDLDQMMKQCGRWISKHRRENLTAERMGEWSLLRPQYFCYLFSCYYERLFEEYLEDIRSGPLIPADFGLRAADSGLKSADVAPGPANADISAWVQTVKAFTVEGMVIVPVGRGLNDPMAAAQQMAEERTEVEGQWYTGYRIALWGHSGDYRLQYVTGRVSARRADGWKTQDDGTELIRVGGGEYAVFGAQKSDSSGIDTVRRLIRYAFGPWKKENPGWEDKKRMSLEIYGEDRVWFCLPVVPEAERTGFPSGKEQEFREWQAFLEEHIGENIGMKELFEATWRSESYIWGIFHELAGMSFRDYMRRERVRQAAKELEKGAEIADTGRKYGYRSLPNFTKTFQWEFGISPKDYRQAVFETARLSGSCGRAGDELKGVCARIREMRLYGEPILRSPDRDGAVLARYWEENGFPRSRNQSEGDAAQSPLPEGEISLWVRNPSYTGRRDHFLYLLCPAAEDGREEPEGIPVTLPGGFYAMVSVDRNLGRKDPGETLRTLHLGVFDGWLRETRWQADRERLPFFRWMGEKLSLFLPVNSPA